MEEEEVEWTSSAVVGRAEDFVDGQLKEVAIGESDGDRALIVKSEGKIRAFSHRCTHYGAPLSKGSYSAGVVRCPWHGACFSTTTGDIEDFPGLDSLHVFEVAVDDAGDVRVRAPKKALTDASGPPPRRTPAMTRRSSGDARTAVVVGGGGAAQACVETLRARAGFAGRVVIVSREDTPPYDRPKLSKALGSTAQQVRLRPDQFYNQGDIELMLGMEAVSLDVARKTLSLAATSTGQERLLGYDFLVLATGSTPRTLPFDGADLAGVFTLRTIQDANAIDAAAGGKHVCVVGSSFIGMEVAAALADKAASVTVVTNADLPFKPLGPHVGNVVKALHESAGVAFKFCASLSGFDGAAASPGRLAALRFADGSRLDADVCVVGIGVKPNTQFLKGSGVELDDAGHVIVDEFMETSVPGVFAAGDIASTPLPVLPAGQRAAIGHWQLAHALGRAAAVNLAAADDRSRRKPIRSVPFFWTVQFGKSIRYAGFVKHYDEAIVEGDEQAFAVYYCVSDVVAAIATFMKDPLAAKFANWLQEGKPLEKQNIPKFHL